MTKNKLSLVISICTNFILVLTLFFIGTWISQTERIESLQTISEFNGTIYAGNQNSNKVSIMINVYWGDEHLERMLETLKEHNKTTTFFLGASWVKDNANLSKKIKEYGHEIGSHASTHASLGKLDFNQNYNEIKTCHDIVQNMIGIQMNLLAPPSGSYNKNTILAAESLGYKTIMWTRDTIDWRDCDETIIYSRAINNMKGGDLILMHPTKESADALPKILEYMEKHNFELTTVSKTLE